MFVVNLKGRPFMGGLSENRPLLFSLAATLALTFMGASETIPMVRHHARRDKSTVYYDCTVNNIVSSPTGLPYRDLAVDFFLRANI